jgi:hypothetical protein
MHNLEFIYFFIYIFILSIGTNSSKTEKPGIIWCRRQNSCKVVVSEEDEEQEEDIHSIAVYLYDILLNMKHHTNCMEMYELL